LTYESFSYIIIIIVIIYTIFKSKGMTLMPPKPRILVVGSANIDFVTKVERIPESGETFMSGGTYSFLPGGKGANAAVSAARLGADVVFCARTGNDTYGKALRKLYADEGIDTRFLVADKEENTGLASIVVERNGKNRITYFPGANKNLSSDDVEEAFTSYPDALLLQFETPIETVNSAISFANRSGVPVFVDAGPVSSDINIASFGPVEIFSPNETEAYALTGIRPINAESYIRICLDLYSRLKVKYIVLKLGDKGCYMYDGHLGEAFPSYHVNAVDTTAAGDAFTSALAYEYLRSGNIRSACKYANAVGALTTTKVGAVPSLPTENQVMDFLKNN
jgi:ribokinase